MSDMENGKAVVYLGFRPEPVRHYLDKIVATFLNARPAEPPPNYAHRASELALAAEVTRLRSAVPKAPVYDWRDEMLLEDTAADGPPTTQEDLGKVLVRHGIDTTSLAPMHSGPDGTVYRLVVPGEQALDNWHALRAIVATTGYWPVLLGDEEWATAAHLQHGVCRGVSPGNRGRDHHGGGSDQRAGLAGDADR